MSEPVDIGTRSSSQVRGIMLGILAIAAELASSRFQADAGQQLVAHMPWWREHLRTVQWIVLSVPFLILALAVGLGARSERRALIAVGLSFAGAAVAITSYELLDFLLIHSTPSPSTLSALDLATVMLVSTLAALAWSVARRYGVAWMPALLLIASIGAGVLRWWAWPAQLHSLDGYRLSVARTGLELVPILTACVVAWSIESKSHRDA